MKEESYIRILKMFLHIMSYSKQMVPMNPYLFKVLACKLVLNFNYFLSKEMVECLILFPRFMIFNLVIVFIQRLEIVK